MELLNRESIELLLKQRGKGPCVSIYMPTVKGREKAKENSVRFKSLLDRTEEQLAEMGLDNRERAALLSPARQLIGESIFWASQSDGLAYFLAEGFTRVFRLPLQFEEMTFTGNSLHLKPLFSLLASDGQFYLLAISQNDARLLRGTRALVEEMDLSQVVERFEREFGDELPEQHLQYHTGLPDTGGGRSAIYFGHGGEIDSIQRERLLKYFRFIDRELLDVLGDRNAPLLLACVDYLYPLYREASKYPLLLDGFIKGNYENINAQDLHKKAWEIVSPYFRQKQEEAKALYLELKGTGKTSNTIEEIVTAAFYGRISDIFVTVGIQQWGSYDRDSEKVVLDEAPRSGNEDLIDLAVTETFLTNGNVYTAGPELQVDTSPVAAIFRW